MEALEKAIKARFARPFARVVAMTNFLSGKARAGLEPGRCFVMLVGQG